MRSSLPHAAGLLAAAFLTSFAIAQQPSRIHQEIDSSSAVVLPGTVSPRVAAARDLGRLEPGTAMEGVTLWFQPTADQKAQLDALVQAQQTPGSPYYHVWLTPAQYATRFGLSDADLARVENWLESQGFTIDGVSNSRTSIRFSGTAGQIESAFQTEMHRYQAGAEAHYANATDLSVPSALSGIVRSVRNLNDFRPAPQFRPSPATARPAFTSKQTGEHFLTPKDVATIYDIGPAYSSGYTGSGETIAVVGQSEIVASDVTNFQNAAGLTVKAPNMLLVPGTGTAAIASGDEAESDLDVEYSGATATGATIDFIYVGNNQNYSVFDSLQYAIDQKTAPIITMSYGICETSLSSTDYTTLEGIMEQGASQGQSILGASGDSGSTACYDPGGKSGLSTTQQEALAVNYPASSAYAVGVGGSELIPADTASSNTTYWESSSGSDVIGSALSYIPEQTWNDDSASLGQQYGALYAVSSGGGGVSTLTARPSWQTGVSGIASGSFRLVPDVSLASSAEYAPYLYCTSDTSAWTSGQKASCTSGFRDSSTGDLTAAGGTSFATPIFAGMLAMIAQKEGSSLGVASKNLYSLAASSSTYASAFHDITLGGNQCTAGSTYCSSAGASEYAAGAGYDEATGLGSVDFNNLLTAWTGGSSGGSGGGTGGTGSGDFALSATSVTVAQGSSGMSTVTIASHNSYAGTIGFTLTSGNASLNTYGCYTIGNTAVTAGGTATASLTIYTSQSACTGVSGAKAFARKGSAQAALLRRPSPERGNGGAIPVGAAALAGALLLGFRKSRKALSLLSCLVLVAILGFAAGCGSSTGNGTNNSSTSSTSTDVPTGSYTLSLVGADTTTSSIEAATTLTLTVN